MNNLNIFLIRHGESQLNANTDEAKHIPDHALALTDKGRQQAEEAGKELNKILAVQGINKNSVRMWVSPYKRARQTAEIINKAIDLTDKQIREDDMLVEINFGLFDGISKEEQKQKYSNEYAKYEKDRLEKGKFYARRPGGESALDVEMRLRIFFDTIFRDYNAGGPSNLIIVCHGGLINIFLKAFLHKSHEWYYEQGNPSNCSIIQLYGGQHWYVHGKPED